ncbi:MAG: hypothetical protein JST00_24205 [Deltaproteobacteria bacterium]|nr:hypothetical protein [Deltaproteobacteria bacterium]
MKRRKIWPAGAVATFLCACAQVLGIEDLTRESVDGNEAGAADAPGDGAEAGPDRGGFCANLTKVPSLCADFDDGGLGGLEVELKPSAGTSSVTASSAVALSPPNALRASVATTEAEGRAHLKRFFASSSPSRLTATFDLYLEAADPGKNLELAAFELRGSSKRCFLTVSARNVFSVSEVCYVNTASEYTVDHLGTAPVPVRLKRWVRIDLGVRLAGGTRSVSLKVDGTDAFVDAPLDPRVQVGPVQFTAGIHFADRPTNVIVFIDNLVADVQP